MPSDPAPPLFDDAAKKGRVPDPKPMTESASPTPLVTQGGRSGMPRPGRVATPDDLIRSAAFEARARERWTRI